MRISFWYPVSTNCAWSISQGAINELRRMGHEVLAVAVPAKKPEELDPGLLPSVEQLGECDRIIISGPEYISGHFAVRYPQWRKIKAPKAGWLHETVRREDYGILDLELARALCDKIFCPAVQDQEYGLQYLPFGVDTQVFRPDPAVKRDINCGFIGLMYPKRREFLNRLVPSIQGIDLVYGSAVVEENGVVRAFPILN